MDYEKISNDMKESRAIVDRRILYDDINNSILCSFDKVIALIKQVAEAEYTLVTKIDSEIIVSGYTNGRECDAYIEGFNKAIDQCTLTNAKVVGKKDKIIEGHINVFFEKNEEHEKYISEQKKVVGELKEKLSGRLEYEAMRDEVILELKEKLKKYEWLEKEQLDLLIGVGDIKCSNGKYHEREDRGCLFCTIDELKEKAWKYDQLNK